MITSSWPQHRVSIMLRGALQPSGMRAPRLCVVPAAQSVSMHISSHLFLQNQILPKCTHRRAVLLSSRLLTGTTLRSAPKHVLLFRGDTHGRRSCDLRDVTGRLSARVTGAGSLRLLTSGTDRANVQPFERCWWKGTTAVTKSLERPILAARLASASCSILVKAAPRLPG